MLDPTDGTDGDAVNADLINCETTFMQRTFQKLWSDMKMILVVNSGTESATARCHLVQAANICSM